MVDDPVGKFYVPYVGLRGKGRKCCGCETILLYRWRVAGSPLIWSNWRDPNLINCTCEQGQEITNTLYTLNANSGGFVEGEFEGIYPVTRNLRGTLWLAGSWLEVTGTGQVTSTVATSTIFRAASGAADVNDSSLRRTYYGLGLGLEVSF